MTTRLVLPAAKDAFSNDDIVGMLAKKDLNFEVGKIKTPNPVPGQFGVDTGFYTAYRKDTGKVFQQGLTDRWHTIQNQKVFEVLAKLSKVTDTKLVDIRSFHGGAEVAAQIQLGDPKFVDGKDGGGGVGSGRDRVSNFLSVIFAHDGTRSLSMYMAGMRWVCSNMINPSFRAAVAANKKGKKALITIQHSQNADEKLKEIVKGVEIAHGEFQHSMDLYRTLRDTKIDTDLMNHIVSEFFPIEKDASKKKINNWTNAIKDISHRFNDADGGLQPVDSAWNLYNSVQGHIQHYTTRKAGISEASYKSTLIGSNETMAANVLRTIIEQSIGMSAVNLGTLAHR